MEQNNNYGRWAELIPELLNEINKLFYCYNDYANFRAVCKHWNTALPNIPNYHPYPWLILPFDDKTLHNCVVEKKIYHILLPEMHNTKLRGSSFGWLIGVGIDGTVRMLNPFTKKHIDLPPLSTFPGVISYYPNDPSPPPPDDDDDDDEHSEYTIIDHALDQPYHVSSKRMQKAYIQKVILSCPPDDVNQDFMAIALYGNCTRLAFYRRGCDVDNGVNNKWIDLPKPGRVSETARQSDYRYDDAIFHAGKIYVIDKEGQIFGFDLPVTQQLSSSLIEVPAPQPLDLQSMFIDDDCKYLIGCPDGGLLMVVRGLIFYANPNPNPKIRLEPYYSAKFEIFKLDKGAKQWSRVSNLEEKNCMLFIGYNSSIWIPNVTTIQQGNQLHFSDNFWEYQYPEIVGGHDIGVLNLENGNITPLFQRLITLISSTPIWLV